MPASRVAQAALCCCGAATATQLTPAQTEWLLHVSRDNATPGAFPAASPAQLAGLGDKAAAHQATHEASNLRHGLSVDIDYTDATFATESRYDDTGDSACWTGHYLAALAHQYNVTRDAAVLRQINATLGAFRRLLSCSGAVGYLARYVGPTDDALYKAYYTGYKYHYDGVGDEFAAMTVLGDASRDQYLGTWLGLAAVATRVGDAAVRGEAVELLLQTVAYLEAHDWWIRPPQEGQGSLVNPSAITIAIPIKIGLLYAPEKYAKYRAKYDSKFKSGVAGSKCGPKWSEGFVVNLQQISLYTLAMLETEDAAKVAQLESVLAYNAVDGGLDHLQASFYAHYAAFSPKGRADPLLAGALQAVLLDYVGAPKRGADVDLSNSTMYQPHHDAAHSEYAVLPRDRFSQDSYIWQRTPCQLKMGGSNKLWQSIDLFYPYWLARFAGLA